MNSGSLSEYYAVVGYAQNVSVCRKVKYSGYSPVSDRQRLGGIVALSRCPDSHLVSFDIGYCAVGCGVAVSDRVAPAGCPVPSCEPYVVDAYVVRHMLQRQIGDPDRAWLRKYRRVE